MNAKAIKELNVGVSNKLEQVLAPTAGKQIRVFSGRLLNGSGSTISSGLFVNMANETRSVYELLSGTYTDVTSTINAGSQITLCTTSANSGIVVQAPKKFHALKISSNAQTGSPTLSFQYYNGSSFVTVPSINESFTSYANGTNLFVFSAPNDWAVGGGGALDSDMYSIRIISTSSTNAPVSTSITAYYCVDFQYNIADNAALSVNFSENYPHHLQANEGVSSYFSVAGADNRVTAFYTIED